MRKLDIFILSAAFALGSAFSFSEKTTVYPWLFPR